MSTGNKQPDATDRSAADQPTIGQIRVEEIQGIINIIDGVFGVPPTGSRTGNGFAFTPEQLDNLASRARTDHHYIEFAHALPVVGSEWMLRRDHR